METNQTIEQAMPAQPRTAAYDQSQEPAARPCHPAKLAQIVEALRELLDPAFIIQFGQAVGGTPHSDVAACDLLIVVDGRIPYDWFDTKRYLKLKLPYIRRGIPYVNLYVHTRHDVETLASPFFYLSRREGVVLYSGRGQQFKRPRAKFDFGSAAAAAERYARTFLPTADRLTAHAGQHSDGGYLREAAVATAQAAILYLRTLFYVYHGFEADTCTPTMLYNRLRPLSAAFSLLFSTDDLRTVRTLSRLDRYADRAQYDPEFFVEPDELALHLDRVRRLGETVAELCARRIALYGQRAR